MADDIYVVEKILSNRRGENGEMEYLLKWLGYEEEEASWEPEENVFCKDLIRLYEKNVIDEECRVILSELLSNIENQIPEKVLHSDIQNTCRKRTNTSSLTRKKKCRSDSIDNQSTIVDENANEQIAIPTPSIDYLSLEPERIVSITRSRLPTPQLEFLLQCRHCPTKLYFISNEKAKELVPDLLIEFYEKHINWFMDKPPKTTNISTRRLFN